MSEQHQTAQRYDSKSPMRRPESSRQPSGAQESNAVPGSDNLERQNHLMQAILLLLKECEPADLELVRRDLDKRLQSSKGRAV